MGWVADGSNGGGERLVDSMINELVNYLETKSGICHGYTGIARKCCNGIYSCFVKLRDALLNIKAAHIDSQDLDSACRQIQGQLGDASTCIDDKTSRCDLSLRKTNIRTPFYTTVKRLTDLYDGYCTKTTPTEPVTTTPERPPSTTPIPPTPPTTVNTNTSSSTIAGITTSPTLVVDADADFIRANNVTSLPESNDDTIIIASSAAGATVIVAVVVIVIVFLCLRKRQPTPYESDSSTHSKKGFIWRWLHTSKPGNQYADSEIYTEIDEAFMDAVYQLSRDPPPKVRNKIQHAAQINICYGTGQEDDIIQCNSDTHPPPFRSEEGVNSSAPSQSEYEYETPLPLNARDLIRKHDEESMAFNPGCGTKIQNTSQTSDHVYKNVSKGIGSNAVLVLPNQKGFIHSRPAFTAVTQSTSNDYVQIEARDAQETIYSEPSDCNSVYDTTVMTDHKYLSKSPNVYHKIFTYENTGTNKKQNKKQKYDVPEHKTSPNYIYENPCLEY